MPPNGNTDELNEAMDAKLLAEAQQRDSLYEKWYDHPKDEHYELHLDNLPVYKSGPATSDRGPIHRPEEEMMATEMTALLDVDSGWEDEMECGSIAETYR